MSKREHGLFKTDKLDKLIENFLNLSHSVGLDGMRGQIFQFLTGNGRNEIEEIFPI